MTKERRSGRRCSQDVGFVMRSHQPLNKCDAWVMAAPARIAAAQDTISSRSMYARFAREVRRDHNECNRNQSDPQISKAATVVTHNTELLGPFFCSGSR